MRTATLFVLAGLLGLIGLPSQAQSFQVRTYVQPERGISEVQPIRFVIEVEGSGSPKLGPVRLPAMKNLRVIGGPENQMSSVWTNGRFSSTTRLIYTLLADSTGPAEIPGLTVNIGDESYSTETIRFNVEKAAQQTPNTRPRTPSRQTRRAEEADLFVRAELGASKVWLGETLPLTLLLYSAEQVLANELESEPSLSSFWVEEVEVDPNAEAFERQEGRRVYRVFPVRRQILVPQTPGTHEIEPYVMKSSVRSRRRGDPFDLFNFGRGQTVIRKTEPLSLEVLPLPTAGRPEGFGGAVGQYEFSVKLDRTESAVNDAVSVSATVQGIGSLRAVESPLFVAPPDLKVFEPKVTSSYKTRRGKMTSSKTWEWIVVPLSPGDLQLPEIRFPYFDPKKGDYVTETATPPLITVQRGDSLAADPVARGEIQLQRRDLAFIKPLRHGLRFDSPRTHRQSWFVGMMLAPVAWVPIAIYLGRRRNRLQQNRGLARSRSARSTARKRLKHARSRLQQTEGTAFHEELAGALLGYVADRFDCSASGLTYERTDEMLAGRNLDPELRRRFRACLESCDFARFVPATESDQQRAKLIKEAESLVDLLEKAG